MSKHEDDVPDLLSVLEDEADWPLAATPAERLHQAKAARRRRTAMYGGAVATLLIAGTTAAAIALPRDSSPQVATRPAPAPIVPDAAEAAAIWKTCTDVAELQRRSALPSFPEKLRDSDQHPLHVPAALADATLLQGSTTPTSTVAVFRSDEWRIVCNLMITPREGDGGVYAESRDEPALAMPGDGQHQWGNPHFGRRLYCDAPNAERTACEIGQLRWTAAGFVSGDVGLISFTTHDGRTHEVPVVDGAFAYQYLESLSAQAEQTWPNKVPVRVYNRAGELVRTMGWACAKESNGWCLLGPEGEMSSVLPSR